MLYRLQPILPGFSAKLNWTSEKANHSQHTSGAACFQMIFEVDENPTTLVKSSLVIKNFLHKIIMVNPKIRFYFSVNVNGIFSKEIFGAENEPTLNLSNGIALVVNCQHYVSIPKFGTTKLLCGRIHPVLGHSVMLCIPDDMAETGFLGELRLTPAAALCPCPKGFSGQWSGISSLYIFLYGPLGLPLILPGQEQTVTMVFRDTSFIDWNKYHLCMVHSLDHNLDRDLVLPDVSYQAESSERGQHLRTDPQGQTLLLFLFVDFHSRLQAQHMEPWGVHVWLTTHLSRILVESHSAVQDSLQLTVDRTLEQHCLATKGHQTLQTSLSVAVNSIMSIVTGSTSSSFRNICLQTLQAADTQEFRTKLNQAFYELTQHQFTHHSSCEVNQVLPDTSDVASSAQDTHGDNGLEPFGGKALAFQVSPEKTDFRFPTQQPGAECTARTVRGPGGANPRLGEGGADSAASVENRARQEPVKLGFGHGLAGPETGFGSGVGGRAGSSSRPYSRASFPPGAARPEEGAKRRRRGSPGPGLGPEESPALGGAGSGLEDALWQREVANLAEWLRPDT
ncbi:type 2 DNA topoisomerase 6 subunit B-like [Suncus etruscus]|uniref:type 2 DNA topoisomerase 6 subunit B-like n=1 Tax=Suncus etruscus TaxID=109475 RepID=UPI00210F5B7D|nr:type 2 DNA topoisomerase 6 subunit B-like [Suncus etruscus]